MNTQGLVDLMIRDVPRGVDVPMVSQSKADIPKWNAKVPHYVDFVFILQTSSYPKVVPSSFSTQMTCKFSNRLENS